MREAVFLLDLVEPPDGWHEPFTQGGLSLGAVEEVVCREFGGVTITLVQGCWFNNGTWERDKEVQVTIAAEWTFAAEEALAKLILRLAAGQKTAYVRWADGSVNLLAVPSSELLSEPHTTT